MDPPAHKVFIDRYLDWEKVKERLGRYEHIRAQYSIEFLQQCSKKRPYYCHYLAWRLGTWRIEGFFEFLDDLFANGSSLNNWDCDANRSLLRNCTFGDFWGLVWQLQLAKLFCCVEGAKLEWMESGPDLKVDLSDESFFIECYTYRKSFAIEEFIGELYNQIGRRMRIEHNLCLQYGLPQDADGIELLLGELFKPLLDQAFLKSKLKEAETQYPVLLPKPDSVNNFYVYVEGNSTSKYIPDRVRNDTGDPEVYLRHAIDEAVNNKRGSNDLKAHRPNLLAINYLLDADFQMALDRQKALNMPIPTPDFGDTFDAVMFGACGIDKITSIDTFHLASRPGLNHPVLSFLRPTAGCTLSNLNSERKKENATYFSQ